ncbi:hypothetical protein QQ008_25875 [Fulvivirgaceae bacterium BMA10]|uniref:Uncharacterized protein n=1 Tax=Splendidivirga corallicola TaxID=3051826 RepID=A0ABT8KVP1_9BACT|nr:hypothetical protein [Fulvivirgaceae bacterium BMA10]
MKIFGNKINWLSHFIELVVVIIGITVAFTINKWSESRGEKELEVSILKSLQSELQKDIDVYKDHQIPRNKLNAGYIEGLSSIIDSNDLEHDSLYFYLDRFMRFNNWRITRSTYESLKSTNRMDIISNFELKKNVIALYEHRSGQNDFVIDLNKNFLTKMQDYLIKNSSLYFQENTTDLAFLRDREFRNLLANWLNLTKGKIKEFEITLEACEQLHQAVTAEIQRHE